MKFFTQLKTSNEAEAKKAIVGFGFVEAMDYETEKRGHLFLVSLNTDVVWFLKKLFIPF